MRIEAATWLPFLKENLETIVSQSEPLWHPLGFVSCVVFESPKSLTLRIHFWPKHERRTKNPDWPIHTHAYHLSSYVLAGSIHDIQYRQSASRDYTIYSVNYYEGGSEIVDTGLKTGIATVVHETRRAGETYEVPLGVFHQTQVHFDQSAVTLVAQSEFISSPPLVLGTSGQSRYPYDRMPFDRDRFWTEVSASFS